MIQFFRNLFSSKIGAVFALLFVVLIFFAFALADINAPGGMFSSSNAIATVGDQEITEEQITDRLNQRLQAIRQQQPGVDMNILVQQGELDNLIDTYARIFAMRQFAEDNGLVFTKALVDAAIASDPNFRGLTGEFDETAFRQILAARGITEANVREDLTFQLVERLVLRPIQSGFVTAAAARPIAELFLERRRGRIAAVPAEAMPDGDPPTAEQLQRYYNDNIDRYTLPERRAVRYAAFDLSNVDVPDPTEEQVRAYYRENQDEYGGTQTRTLYQVILPSEGEANAFYRAVNGGTDFAAAARERGFSSSAITVSNVTQEVYARQSDEAVARAAFGADEGALVRPVESDLGWHVVRVNTITTRDATPLAAVRPEITQALREELSQQALAEFYLEIENAIEDGASFEEVVEAKGLQVRNSPLVTPGGVSPTRPDYRPDPELGPVLQLAFQMDEDDDPELVAITQDERFALVDVTQVAQTGPQPLQRIREIVSAQYVAERANRRARRVADGIVEKVNDGTPLTEAMAEAGVTLPPPEQVAMSRAQLLQMGENIPAPLELLFQMATDTAKLIRLPQDRGWFIVILDEIIASDEELPDGLIEQTREEFATITGNEYAQQFVNAVLADYPLTRDEAAIEALGARLTGRAP